MATFGGIVSSTSLPFNDTLSSTTGYGITTSGDMFRISTLSTVASNAAGNPGEIRIGVDGGVGYIYVCIATGDWRRVALTASY